MACQEGHRDVVQTLLGAGADVNVAASDVSDVMFYWYMYVLKYSYIYIWDSSRENDNSHLYIKCYINASRLNRYIFRMVNAINIPFSTLHTTPFLYGKICFGVLYLLLASTATFDTPPGSNLP